MKNKLLILFFLVLLTGCSNQKPTPKETVTAYYNAFDSGNFNEIKTLISDTITIKTGDFVTPYSGDGFYEFFKWDSIFKPSYEIVELEEKNNHILATVAQENIRNKFLKNNPLTFKVKVSFDSGKISNLEELEYIKVNWDVWNKQKDSLVDWIKSNHPELDGFVNDMTKKGSINYLKAIELYSANQNTL